MEQRGQDPLTPNHAIAMRVKELRKGRGWSAARLAEEMQAVGIPWQRMVVTKLETGTRQAVSVEELLALAYVLDVAPVHLIVPTEDDRRLMQIAPNVGPALPAIVRSWIRGNDTIGAVDPRRFASQVPAHEFGPDAEGMMTAAQAAARRADTFTREGYRMVEKRDDTTGVTIGGWVKDEEDLSDGQR